MQLPQKRCNSLHCTVRSSQKESGNQRVYCYNFLTVLLSVGMILNVTDKIEYSVATLVHQM